MPTRSRERVQRIADARSLVVHCYAPPQGATYVTMLVTTPLGDDFRHYVITITITTMAAVAVIVVIVVGELYNYTIGYSLGSSSSSMKLKTHKLSYATFKLSTLRKTHAITPRLGFTSRAQKIRIFTRNTFYIYLHCEMYI